MANTISGLIKLGETRGRMSRRPFGLPSLATAGHGGRWKQSVVGFSRVTQWSPFGCRQAELLPAIPSISAAPCVRPSEQARCTGCTRPSSRSASLILSASAPSVDGIVGRSHSPNFRPCFLPRHHADVTAFVRLDGSAIARLRRCGGRLGWLRYAAAQEQEHG